jgi:hypothetical protein
MTDPIMPDFVDALEARLRVAATTVTSASAPAVAAPVHRRSWSLVRLSRARLAAGTALCAAAVVAFLVLSASDDRRTPAAYGRPLILSTPPVDASQHLARGVTMLLAFGPNAKIESARPFPASGGTGYLVKSDKGWCLSAPDPAAANPDRERGVTCAPTSVFYRYGISLSIGPHFVAAIPQGVAEPTVTLPDGTVQHLKPSDQGVVATDAPVGAVIRLHAADGSVRAMRLRKP